MARIAIPLLARHLAGLQPMQIEVSVKKPRLFDDRPGGVALRVRGAGQLSHCRSRSSCTWALGIVGRGHRGLSVSW